MFTPDFWGGCASVAAGNGAAEALGRSPGGIAAGSFGQIVLTTLLEGFLLSFLLLMIAFFALVFLQIRERGKSFSAAA